MADVIARETEPCGEHSRALDDLRRSLSDAWFWGELGWNDILQRYRGSLLGPFWITLTTAVFIAGLGPLYARLFSLKYETYLPFMAYGVVTWGFITSCINESCQAFISCGYMMKQVRTPYLAIILRVIWRNMIVFAHNAPIFLAVAFVLGPQPGWRLAALAPGFLLVCLNLIWMGLVAAIVCARFRDIVPIVAAALQIGFFVTPVMWNPQLQNVDAWIININPFAAMIELVRAPILGLAIAPDLLWLSLATLVFGYGAAYLLFVRCRRRIIFWV